MPSNRTSFRRHVLPACRALVCGLLMAAFSLPAVAADKPLVRMADKSWESVQVHNRIVGFFLENAYGYRMEYMTGETIPMVNGLIRGDVDVDMESWTENIQEIYDKGISSGAILDLGSNYPDSWQGWLVPTYLIKGDPERGIEPLAPDLKSVHDLPKYWHLFKDPEDPRKGRLYNSIPGWGVTDINEKKFKAYGLDKKFNLFLPGSDAALAGSMVAAYKKGQPWLGYYWAPTWVLGKLDMTPLEEPPYDEKVWETTHACAFPSVQVNILVNAKFAADHPDVVAFLKNYETTVALNNEILAYMEDHGGDAQTAALWFLREKPEVWKTWVEEKVAQKITAALK